MFGLFKKKVKPSESDIIQQYNEKVEKIKEELKAFEGLTLLEKKGFIYQYNGNIEAYQNDWVNFPRIIVSHTETLDGYIRVIPYNFIECTYRRFDEDRHRSLKLKKSLKQIGFQIVKIKDEEKNGSRSGEIPESQNS